MDSRKQPDDLTDRETFVRLLMRHDRVIRAFLRSLLPTIADVDEVMQEVSVAAWRKFGELDHPDNFRAWACGIARYEVLMYRRKIARDRLVLSEDLEQVIATEGVEELPLRQRQLEALEGCIGKLPEERKRLLLRAYAPEQTMKALAEQIGKTPEALYKLLSRLRRELLACVERATTGSAL